MTLQKAGEGGGGCKPRGGVLSSSPGTRLCGLFFNQHTAAQDCSSEQPSLGCQLTGINTVMQEEARSRRKLCYLALLEVTW